MQSRTVAHLIKSEDLNHHGTLFAGRLAEWLVEAAFIAAAEAVGRPEAVVCVKVHGLQFRQPARRGDILIMNSLLVRAGRTSLMVYTRVGHTGSDVVLVDGFLTFVCVNDEGSPMEHHIVLPEPENDAERRLRAEAARL